MPGMRSLPLPAVLQTLNRLDTKYAALAAIGVTTGCRISEILSLTRRDLITADGKFKDRIKFVKLKSKSEKPQHRQLIIPEDFQKWVKKHLTEEAKRGYERPDDYVFRGKMCRHLSRTACYQVFREVLGKGYGTHWMRKTFAQEIYKYLLQETPNDMLRALDLTRQALGHARIDTTIKYLGLNYQSIDQAQSSIFKTERIMENAAQK
ncbi:MAG: site-specific integrase [Lentisphaeria bacterium]|nr:site-specific integrase [Lentisphaeria bacterium]